MRNTRNPRKGNDESGTTVVRGTAPSRALAAGRNGQRRRVPPLLPPIPAPFPPFSERLPPINNRLTPPNMLPPPLIVLLKNQNIRLSTL